MANRATIKDVSRAAGVSAATVSNAINTPGLLASDTLQRVTDAIDKLEYTPNRAAVALRKQKASAIGYRMPSGTDGFALDQFLHRLVECAGEADFDIVLFTPREGRTEIEEYEEMIRRGAVDGFVLSGTDHHDERVDYLNSMSVPFATFGRTDTTAAHNWVDIDGEAGVRSAVDHLIGLGHERVALIRWPEGPLAGDDRAAGYSAGLAAAGIEVDPGYVIETENGVDQGAAAAERFLDLETPPTAIVCVQDWLALGVIRSVVDRGLELGSDVSVVGFDDIPSASLLPIGLTSVHQPMHLVGEALLSILLDTFDDEAEPGLGGEMVEPDLVVRGSSGAPKKDHA